ncbi:hypothetical protein K504DRAFT_507907 [Pleomassaria siparia CBS 279.74]|uniref:Uncharacterized protein n=1 Tax=Pleomassaria siparia CBS 279.74 TaxID=1314801 RepID=A0A6G1JT09_9PLEO|nr:hypothetical protein K504DRAFT_507907 [Pleomassaria siparia CBS 279.74]
MGGQSYTVEQLQRLRDSHLVQKPDNLPSILQWMDVPADANNASATTANAAANRRPRSGNLRDGEALVTGDNRAERLPALNPMGHFGRRASTRESTLQDELVSSINALFLEPEETVLGPPKLSFASASRNVKAAAELPEKRTGIAPMDGDQLGDRFPRERGERWARDRDTNREKGGLANGRRPPREGGEGWADVKGRKSLGQEDFDRGFGRNGDRDREKPPKEETENGETSTRRATTTRWRGRDEVSSKEVEGAKHGVTGPGGWRDRERDKEQRGGDRDWNRGGKAEADPEWMDSPSDKHQPKSHTQEDFQRWKDSMKAKDHPVEDKEEPKAEQAIAEPSAVTNTLKQVVTPSSEPSQGILFGNWGRDTVQDSPGSDNVPKPRVVKNSRFMKMFEKPEEPTMPSQLPPPTPASPITPHMPGLGVDPDKEGFQRILQMLGGVNMAAASQPSQPSVPTPTNGSRPGGGIALDFVRPSPPEEQENRQQPRQQVSRTLEQQHMLENILAPKPGQESRPSQTRLNAMSPDNGFLESFGLPRPDSNRPGDEFAMQQPPPRNSSAQDSLIHTILNGRTREDTSRDPQTKQRERDFLYTLMQQPSRGTPPQMHHQNLPRPGPDVQNVSFYDGPAQRHPSQQKGRPGIPPGFMDHQGLYQDNEMMRREAERREQMREANMRELNMQHQQQQEALRNKNARLQMNYAHEDSTMMNLQRRNTAGEIPRQMTNMGIPSQALPEMQYLAAGRQPGMPPTPQEQRPNIAPPPGFGGPPIRQPPGLGGHVGQQQQHQHQQQMGPGPSFSAGNTPLGHPPGFAPPIGMRGNMYPGPGQGSMAPQGPPPTYFPPQGYGPPMGLRADDPRMLFDQPFNPNQRQAPRGPPNIFVVLHMCNGTRSLFV